MVWNRKEYDKNRARKIYLEYKERRDKVFELFDNKCYICNCVALKGFHLHHMFYHPVESNYPRHSKSMYIRLKRLKEAEDHPERFALLCAKDHLLLEKIKSLYNKNNIDLNKLINLIQN